MGKIKYFLLSIIVLGCIVAAFMWDIQKAGYTPEQEYFAGQEQGSATSPYEFPVYIITGNIINNKTNETKSPSYRLPTNLRCTADAELCDKIKFVGDFSDADKRKYQSLIIRQIKNIDAILTSSQKIQDTLFSLTIDSGKGSRRGRAGSATITISLGNIKTQEEFLEILTHELGHVVDLGILKGNRRILQNLFANTDHTYFAANDPSLEYYRINRYDTTTRSSDSTALDFVGGYGMSNPFEDFAESFNMYLNHHNVFATLAISNDSLEKKYLYMAKLFGKKYLKADVATANDVLKTPNTRPRDSTKGY